MKRIVLALFALAALSMFTASAQAHGFGHNHGHNHGHIHGRIGHFHAPSLHFHRVYHPTHLHWTPNRGWHTHGHFDLVPHYTPGHFHW
jgi:hypothetical protein